MGDWHEYLSWAMPEVRLRRIAGAAQVSVEQLKDGGAFEAGADALSANHARARRQLLRRTHSVWDPLTRFLWVMGTLELLAIALYFGSGRSSRLAVLNVVLRLWFGAVPVVAASSSWRGFQALPLPLRAVVALALASVPRILSPRGELDQLWFLLCLATGAVLLVVGLLERREPWQDPPAEARAVLRVLAGDDLDATARDYGVTPTDLRRWTSLFVEACQGYVQGR
jgi:hypothetical protein